MCNLSEGYIERGIERGMAQGIAQGVAQGVEQGRAEEHQRIQPANAKRLLAKGISIPEIAELLDENVEQIQKWLF